MKSKKWLAVLMSAFMCVPVFVAGCNKTPDNSDKDDTEQSGDDNTQGGNQGGNELDPNWDKDLAETNVYFVGDSTVCGFSDPYYIPRYGYGTQFQEFVSSKVKVNNLALSGRSSYSFIYDSKNANYNTLKSGIKSGDYLIIGFGHNDQKSDIYTDPNLSSSDTTTISANADGLTSNAVHYASFKYTLKHFYIDVAIEKGATPILCTPIVRASDKNDYSGSNAHITNTGATGYSGGDYAKAIRDLGAELDIQVVDLTALTKADYTEKGYQEAINYHAFTAGKRGSDGTTIVRNDASVDNTHTNKYGAKMNAYYIADALKKANHRLGAYVKPDYQKPTYENDYQSAINTGYRLVDYAPFNPDSATPSNIGSLTSEGWYATAFGDIGGNVKDNTNFSVTQSGDLIKVASLTGKGKIGSGSEGFAMAFRQVASNSTFRISATVTVDAYSDADAQSGFGIMVRDDIYIDKNEKSILSNYVASGMYGISGDANVLFKRENATLTSVKKNQKVDLTKEHTLVVERVEETVVVTFDNITQSYPDFDLRAIDSQYFYVCLFATRNAQVTFSNIDFEITGTSNA